MCIAIVKPLGKKLSKELLETCSKNNPDGCGFAYIDNGIIYMKKFMEFKDFYDEYSKVEDKSTMLIHFRIATHGKVEPKNCHPFKLNDRMALIHNGIISGYGDKENKTDTQDFIEKVIGNISWKMWKNPAFIELVNKAIGYSKLGILDVSGNYFIVGEEKGYWVDGVWFSNKSYEPKKTVTYVPYSYNKKDNTYQYSFWDMYGDEDYDTWYSKTYGKKDTKDEAPYNCKVIYKCGKCGKEIILDEDEDNIVCDKCLSDDLSEVGFIFDKERYELLENGDYKLVDNKVAV